MRREKGREWEGEVRDGKREIQSSCARIRTATLRSRGIVMRRRLTTVEKRREKRECLYSQVRPVRPGAGLLLGEKFDQRGTQPEL